MAWLPRTLAFAATALFTSRASAGGSCAIHGDHATVGRVRVQTSGDPLTLHVLGAPVTAYVDARAPTALEVEGTLAFHGSPIDRLPYTLRHATEGSAGVARLPSDQKLLGVRVRGDEVIIDAELDPFLKIAARDITVACDALTLDQPRLFEKQRRSSEKDDGESWMPAGQVLTFHEHPGSGAAVRLTTENPKGVRIRRFREDARWMRPWVRVETEINGAVIAGWVARSAIQTADSRMGAGGAFDTGISCAAEKPSVPALIQLGAEVYAEPGKRPWARAQSTEAFMVRDPGRGDWVQITRVKDLREGAGCPGLSHAFVRRSAVTFTPGAAVSP